MPRSILVADDERKIARLVESYLDTAGFEVFVADDGNQALKLFRERSPDCAILDINMPGLDGIEVAREIRRRSDIPIIFLTARTEETDRIVGLELGADDYVSKPFSPRELVARVRAIFRRARPAGGAESGGAASEPLRRGEMLIDRRKRAVLVSGEPRALTTLQFDILAFLAGEPGRVFTRLELLERSAGTACEGYERTIDAHIKNIRKAIGDESELPKYIATVRGVGYKFIEQSDAT
ncbi:MAG TPA: response regulator transcription factor [Rectinemataceae bacterium]|nr:response regulator transcription factor [Rectinemataceae bacterium]